MKRVLITGAAGLIGAHLVKYLAQDKFEILGLDNFNDYYSPAFKQARIDDLGIAGLVQKTDLCDKPELEKVFRNFQPHFVIHLAGRPGVRVKFEDTTKYEIENIENFNNIIQLVIANKVEKFLFASSSSVYSDSPNVPFAEEQTLKLPESYYAFTKLQNELKAKLAARENLEIVAMRFFSVYGPWSRPDMALLQFASSSISGRQATLFGDGLAKRDFTFVDDVSKVIKELICKKMETNYTTLNICTGKTNTILDLLDLLKGNNIEVNLNKGKSHSSDMQITQGSTERMRELGLTIPSTTLGSGVKFFSDWFKSQENANLIKWMNLS